MADAEGDLADCVGAIYEAAANGGHWQDVGARLCRLTGAQRVVLRMPNGHGSARQNVLMPLDDDETAYLAYYHSLDPYSSQARKDYDRARARHFGTTRLGPQIVPEQSLLHSEYYVDFARRYERRHLLAGLVGVSEATPVSLYRAHDAKPFEASEGRLLQGLLPHLQRALELRARLGRDSQMAWATRAALDGLPIGVAVVDAGLRIHFANQAGNRQLARADSGLRTMRSGPQVGSGVYLAASARDDATALRRLVASATSGNCGGSMRVVNRDMSACAVLVSPAAHGLSADGAHPNEAHRADKLAMVVIRDLGRVASPSVDMLCDVFGFSRAEADVATALSGGASAEDVARQRNVSLATVRSQIRSILGKSESENLRDFERSMASLAAMMPHDPDSAH
jgi:DNA-binding NarL/FixJ family response regulator